MESKEPQERQLGIFFCRLEYENIYQALQTCLANRESVWNPLLCLNTYLGLLNNNSSKLKFLELVYKTQSTYPLQVITQQLALESLLVL